MAAADVTETLVQVEIDPYRSHIYGEGEVNTVWRFGGPPSYAVVNELFEAGRTNVWEVGSVEERVQRLLKTWEMEVVHKVRPEDYKTLNGDVFTHSVNGSIGLRLPALLEIGGYNQFLQTSLPPYMRAYDPSQYTSDEAQTIFLNTFPRGFAIEILEVYSGHAPKVAFKFRHWSFMEGPFQGHAPTGELVEFHGICIFTVDETMLVQGVEFFYDGNELIAQLLKGPIVEGYEPSTTAGSGCPFLSKSS